MIDSCHLQKFSCWWLLFVFKWAQLKTGLQMDQQTQHKSVKDTVSHWLKPIQKICISTLLVQNQKEG